MQTHEGGGHSTIKLVVEVLSSTVAIVGLGVAAALFLGNRQMANNLAAGGAGASLWRLWHNAWGFDTIYDRLFVRPYLMLTRLHRNDWINTTINAVPQCALMLNRALVSTQNGRLRWYALSLFAGAAALLAALLFG